MTKTNNELLLEAALEQSKTANLQLASELSTVRRMHNDLQKQYDDLLRDKVALPEKNRFKSALIEARKQFSQIHEMSESDETARENAWDTLRITMSAMNEIDSVLERER